jgi:rSAM/selenodomain-associated transferase 2
MRRPASRPRAPFALARACYPAAVQLTVVIPALDEADWITGAIESASAAGSEIIVVDGGSRDATPARAAASGARVVQSAPGRARQLAAGARLARGDTILFLHADTRLPAGWDASVRAALADARVVGGAFRLHFEPSSPALRFIEWGTRLRVALFRLPYGDQALFVRRSVLEELGGVPQVPIMEDLDLVRSLKRRGRLACLRPAVTTSARRYRAGGALRTMLRNWLAASGWWLGLPRERIAAWYRR